MHTNASLTCVCSARVHKVLAAVRMSCAGRLVVSANMGTFRLSLCSRQVLLVYVGVLCIE